MPPHDSATTTAVQTPAPPPSQGLLPVPPGLAAAHQAATRREQAAINNTQCNRHPRCCHQRECTATEPTASSWGEMVTKKPRKPDRHLPHPESRSSGGVGRQAVQSMSSRANCALWPGILRCRGHEPAQIDTQTQTQTHTKGAGRLHPEAHGHHGTMSAVPERGRKFAPSARHGNPLAMRGTEGE